MEKRMLIILAAMFTLAVAFPKSASAATNVAGASATLAKVYLQRPVVADHRAEILRAYLQSWNSPLADHAETFIKEADKYNIDWRLLPAISGVESTFGQAIPPGSYNGWGFGIYGTHVQYFGSWDDGIATVSQSIRERYMNERGAQNVYQIGATYAASQTWAARVTGYMSDIDAFAQRNPSADSISISI